MTRTELAEACIDANVTAITLNHNDIVHAPANHEYGVIPTNIPTIFAVADDTMLGLDIIGWFRAANLPAALTLLEADLGRWADPNSFTSPDA